MDKLTVLTKFKNTLYSSSREDEKKFIDIYLNNIKHFTEYSDYQDIFLSICFNNYFNLLKLIIKNKHCIELVNFKILLLESSRENSHKCIEVILSFLDSQNFEIEQSYWNRVILNAFANNCVESYNLLLSTGLIDLTHEDNFLLMDRIAYYDKKSVSFLLNEENVISSLSSDWISENVDYLKNGDEDENELYQFIQQKLNQYKFKNF